MAKEKTKKTKEKTDEEKSKKSKLNNEKIKVKNRNLIKSMVIMLFFFVAVFALVYFVHDLVTCQDYFDNETEQIALNETSSSAKEINSSSIKNFTAIRDVAASVKGVTNPTSLDSIGNNAVKSDKKLLSLQFLDEHTALERYGDLVGSSSDTNVVNLIDSAKYGHTNIYSDKSIGANCIAVYCPVENNADINGVIGYYSVQSMTDGINIKNDDFQMYAVVDGNGGILKIKSQKGFVTDVSTNIYDYIYSICDSKESADTALQSIRDSISNSYMISIVGEKYVLSCVPTESFGNGSMLITVALNSNLSQSAYPLYDRMMSSSIFLCAVILLALAILAFLGLRDREKVNLKLEYDPVIGSYSYQAFYQTATDILKKSKLSKFAVIYFDISKFRYLREHFGDEVSDSLLRYVSNIVKKMLANNECFGRISDDRFVIMLRYSVDHELYDRLRVLNVLIENFEETRTKNFFAHISVGICFVDDRESADVHRLVDHASIAKVVNEQNSEVLFNVYDEQIQNRYNNEAAIEAKMHNDLKNGNFKLFFQPKYNIAKDCIDGAEVLVRWFDPETNSYIAPDNFVGVFEVNGFIATMDRYVYEKACEFLKKNNDAGKKTVPLSINVSRVSAIQTDFLEFYIDIKKKYKIPDNFLTLEFTESFAIENEKKLADIVSTLRNNGFYCSIDDFGQGYSSFGILKELQMDELKLDKFFLNPGKSPEKDEMLLETIINLGKNFGMKVTQEGIENIDDLNRLKSYGCDIIQGYYYSKPIDMDSFVEFISRNTSFAAIAEYHNKGVK